MNTSMASATTAGTGGPGSASDAGTAVAADILRYLTFRLDFNDYHAKSYTAAAAAAAAASAAAAAGGAYAVAGRNVPSAVPAPRPRIP